MKKLLLGLIGLPFAAWAAYLDVATDKDPIRMPSARRRS